MTDSMSPAKILMQQSETLRQNWGWLVALGIGLTLLGVVAIGHAAITSLLVGAFLAVLLIIGGVAHAAHALSTRKWSGFFVQLILGTLLLVAGVVLFFHPVMMASVVALIIGVALFFHGIGQVMIALQHRGVPNWFFFLLSGAVTTLLGFFIMLRWPFSFTIIGIFVGIQLILEGMAFLMLGFAAKSLTQQPDGEQQTTEESSAAP